MLGGWRRDLSCKSPVAVPGCTGRSGPSSSQSRRVAVGAADDHRGDLRLAAGRDLLCVQAVYDGWVHGGSC